MNSNSRTLTLRVGLLLAALTLLCYWPLTSNKFINVDDPSYIVQNASVNSGLTWANVSWAFQTTYACNWHPLTWISHMVDCSLFGLNPAGHHLMNLLLHIANTLLLFALLHRMTGTLWRSAFVAALFAFHPLHVESVAWASERKDVLSTLFFLLTLWAYAKYAQFRESKSGSQTVERKEFGQKSWYRIALVLFALGLMAKPMLVTLPFVLLLLDFWPLQRMEVTSSNLRGVVASLGRRMVEKLPFFALSGASSIITYVAQHDGGAVSSLSTVPIMLRLGNALLAYCRYLGKILWPTNLVAIYPLPDQVPWLAIVSSGLALATITCFVLCRKDVQAFFVTGWFWFLGTLVPTIGLVQVGAQAIADRYTYIPSIGFFLAIVWGGADLVAALQKRTQNSTTWKLCSSSEAWAAVSGCLLLGCMLCTWRQVRYWRDGETLHRHTLQVDPSNYVAHEHLGIALADQGRMEEALWNISESVRLSPSYAEAHYNLGTLLLQKGDLEGAVMHLKSAVKLTPNDANAHHNLGNAYLRLSRLPEATAEFASAAALKLEDAPFRLALGGVLLTQNRLDDAVLIFSEVVRLEPNNLEGHRNLGVALARQGKFSDAVREFEKTVRLDPRLTELRFNLGLALLDAGRPGEAVTQFEALLRLEPTHTSAHYRLATALLQQHDLKGAVAHFREAVRLTPDFPEAMTELAWILATAPEPELRAGEEAVQLARQACNLTEYKQPRTVAALAAAYAETARFSEAVVTAKRARDLALSSGQQDLVIKVESLLKSSEAGQPFRQEFVAL